MHCHQRDRFGDIERGTTAETDHRIGAMRLVGGHALIDLAADGIAPDLGIDGDVETRQAGDECLEHRQRRNAAVGDDERALDALRLQMFGDELACAGAEVNGRGESKAMDHDGCPERMRRAGLPFRNSLRRSARNAAPARRWAIVRR